MDFLNLENTRAEQRADALAQQRAARPDALARPRPRRVQRARRPWRSRRSGAGRRGRGSHRAAAYAAAALGAAAAAAHHGAEAVPPHAALDDEWSADGITLIRDGRHLDDAATVAACGLAAGDFVVMTGMRPRNIEPPS